MQLLYATNCEFGLVLVGSKKTDNHLNETLGTDQYQNVTAFRAIEKMNLDALRSIDSIHVEKEHIKKGDIMDGLIVATDMIDRYCGTKKYKKRVFVITDGEKLANVKPNEMKQVVQNMNATDTRLNVISLDFCDELAEDDEEEEEEDGAGEVKVKRVEKETNEQHQNKEFLMRLTSKVKGAIFPASVALQIYQQFKKREVSARSKYRGNLDLAKDLKLAVQIFSRTREETFPTLKKQSLIAPSVNEGSTNAKEGLIKLDRSYAEVDDPDQIPVDGD